MKKLENYLKKVLDKTKLMCYNTNNERGKNLLTWLIKKGLDKFKKVCYNYNTKLKQERIKIKL